MPSYRNINCMIVPTGIGARIGGYAADANPACKLLAKASDLLITHPNVVNGALLTDIPNNVVVVEGYFLDRFFANQIALRLGVKQKIAVVVDGAATQEERQLTQTCIDAARTVYGIDIMPEIFYTDEAINANDLRQIKNPDTLLKACDRARKSGATALALLAVLDEDPQSQEAQSYAQGQGHDPIGSIEAKISHLVSQIFLLPSAHAPIVRSSEINPAKVDPKVAAEYLSDSFLASVFKCLQASPQIIPLESNYKVLTSGYTNPADLNLKRKADDIIIHDLANLVVPYDCCNGVPMIEAWKHEIQLLCVRNNTTDLDDTADLFNIPHKVMNSYLEAAGYLLANTKDNLFIDPAPLN
jgi:hypothetical protein